MCMGLFVHQQTKVCISLRNELAIDEIPPCIRSNPHAQCITITTFFQISAQFSVRNLTRGCFVSPCHVNILYIQFRHKHTQTFALSYIPLSKYPFTNQQIFLGFLKRQIISIDISFNWLCFSSQIVFIFDWQYSRHLDVWEAN